MCAGLQIVAEPGTNVLKLSEFSFHMFYLLVSRIRAEAIRGIQVPNAVDQWDLVEGEPVFGVRCVQLLWADHDSVLCHDAAPHQQMKNDFSHCGVNVIFVFVSFLFSTLIFILFHLFVNDMYNHI